MSAEVQVDSFVKRASRGRSVHRKRRKRSGVHADRHDAARQPGYSYPVVCNNVRDRPTYPRVASIGPWLYPCVFCDIPQTLHVVLSGTFLQLHLGDWVGIPPPPQVLLRGLHPPAASQGWTRLDKLPCTQQAVELTIRPPIVTRIGFRVRLSLQFRRIKPTKNEEERSGIVLHTQACFMIGVW